MSSRSPLYRYRRAPNRYAFSRFRMPNGIAYPGGSAGFLITRESRVVRLGFAVVLGLLILEREIKAGVEIEERFVWHFFVAALAVFDIERMGGARAGR